MRGKKLMGQGAFALPSIFTAGTIFCGYYSVMHTVNAITLPADRAADIAAQFNLSALAIIVAAFTDGMDGRIARLANAVSDFGRELDSLADVVTFGIAPALLAFTWGIRPIDPATAGPFAEHLTRLGYFLTFLFLVCGAARLARFNVQRNPVPKNPGRSNRRYFVGLPIPAAAVTVAAIIHAAGGYSIHSWQPWGGLWLLLLALLSFLMVCTWRYNSFKELNLLHQRSRFTAVVIAMMIPLVWYFSQPVLLTIAGTYALSGVIIRLGGLVRRRPKHLPQPTEQHN